VSTKLLFLQEPLPVIEHQETTVSVIADERVPTEDSAHKQLRLLRAQLDRPDVLAGLACGAIEIGRTYFSPYQENLGVCRDNHH
jgi:hypothetical protein